MSSISKPMSDVLGKSILFSKCITAFAAIETSNNVSSLRHFSVNSDHKHSFTVSYLINSLGFSPKSALSASKSVKFDSPAKPDKAIEFLKGYGFTHTQISRLVRRRSEILGRSAEKIYLPKLEFLESKGISRPELVKAISVFPTVLFCNLKNQILPTYEFIRDFLKSDKMAVTAFRRFPDILCHKIERYVGPNIAVLQEHGVPHSNIGMIIRIQPRVFMIGLDDFRKVVEEVVEMGFDPTRYNFVAALCVLRGMAKSTWERKANAYKKCGWSDTEIMEAFKRSPRCMTLSEDNIMESMDVFVNRVGLRSCVSAKRRLYLGFSLKKRVIPRLAVFEALLSKGLVKEVSKIKLFEPSENKFLEIFIKAYPDEAPELMKLYLKKIDLSSSPEMDNVQKHNSCKLFGFVPSDQ